MMTKPERLFRRVRIKEGSAIFQDRRFGKWPECCPPQSEYEGEEYQYRAKDPDMEFDGEWDGTRWDCKADGYGHMKLHGDPGEYGNGSIFALGLDSVEVLDT